MVVRSRLAVAGSTALAMAWPDGTASAIEFAGWIARGRGAWRRSGIAAFVRAEVALHGRIVTCDGDEGALAIDGEHQAASDAAEGAGAR